LVRGDWNGKGSASGMDISTSLSVIYSIREGEISSVVFFFDHDKALKAVGLEE
jgi:ketosteroid isomerase-like protein